MAVTPKILYSKTLSSNSISPFNGTLPFYFDGGGSYNPMRDSIKLSETLTVVKSKSATETSLVLNLVSRSGMDLTLLNSITVSGAFYGETPNATIHFLSATKFLLVYLNSTTYYPTAVVCTISNNTIKVGGAYVLASDIYAQGASTYFDVDLFSTTKGVIVYSYYNGSSYLTYSKAFLIGSSAVTSVGSVCNLGGTISYNVEKSVVCISTTQAISIFSYTNSEGSGTTNLINLITSASLTNNTITAGTSTASLSNYYPMRPLGGFKGSDGNAYFIMRYSNPSVCTQFAKITSALVGSFIPTAGVMNNGPAGYNVFSSVFVNNGIIYNINAADKIYSYNPSTDVTAIAGSIHHVANTPNWNYSRIIQVGNTWYCAYKNTISFVITADLAPYISSEALKVIIGEPNKIKYVTSIYISASGGVLQANGIDIFITSDSTDVKLYTTDYNIYVSSPGYLLENNVLSNKSLSMNIGKSPMIIPEGANISIRPKAGLLWVWSMDITIFGFEEDI